MKNVKKDNLPEDIKKDLEKIEQDKIDSELKKELEKTENTKLDELIPPNEEKKVKKSTEELLDIAEEKTVEEDLTIKLKKPINGVSEISLNPDKINGTMLSKIEKMWRGKNRENRETIKELDGEYLAMVAAVLSEVPYSTIMNLGGYDFTQLTSRTRNFLLVD